MKIDSSSPVIQDTPPSSIRPTVDRQKITTALSSEINEQAHDIALAYTQLQFSVHNQSVDIPGFLREYQRNYHRVVAELMKVD